MLSETELNRLYDDIDSLYNQYKELAVAIASLKASLDSLNVDSKSTATSIQNLTMSFGALKEKTDTLFNSINAMLASKDSKVDSAMREGSSRMEDFKLLCSNRVKSIEFKIESVAKDAAKDLAAIAQAINIKVETNSDRITKIENKMSYAVYVVGANLAAFAVWAVKLLGASYGWW